MNLRIPGPTPCPPDVLQAVAGPMINHRGREFAELIRNQTARLKELSCAASDPLILTTSGTGGLEAAVVNTLSPGEQVLSVSIGSFGERFAGIAEAYGASVTRLRYDWGCAAVPDDIGRALREDPKISAVLITHNETSTGVTNPLESIAQVCRDAKKLLLVDAISSFGAAPLEIDAWGLDVVVMGSQKGWMVPPGLAFVTMNDRAWQAYENAKMPRVYFDLGKARDFLVKGQTPWTPALSIIFGLDVALSKMVEEGIQAILARHARAGQIVRDGAKILGLELLADERFASNAVTSIKVPEGVDVKQLRTLLEEEYGVVLAGGQGKLAGKIFRIGHLGWFTEEEIEEALDALGKALPRVGFSLGSA